MLLGIPSKPSEMLRGYPGSRTPSSKRQYWLPWGRDGIGGVSKAVWSPRAQVLWGQPRRFGDPP